MKTNQVVFVISCLSLLSFIISCEENSQILGAYPNDSDQFARVYLKYYLKQEPSEFSEVDYIKTAYGFNDFYDLLVTTPRSGGKIIKNYSQAIDFALPKTDASVGHYYIFNVNALYAFLFNVVYYDYFGDDKDEIVSDDVEVLNGWLVDDPNQASSQNQYKERVVFFGDAALFTKDLNGPRYKVISKAQFLSYKKNSSTEYEFEEPSIYVFDYERVISSENPPELSKIDIKITYEEKKKIPDF